MSETTTTAAAVNFYAERDDYGRSCHIAVRGEGRYVGEAIGAIARLPKRTYPTPTFMVNDYRITRPLLGTEGYLAAIQYVGSLKEAKDLLR